MNEKNNDTVHIMGKDACGGGNPIYSISYQDIMGIKCIDKVTKVICFSKKHVKITCIETPSQMVDRIMRSINEPIKDEDKLRLKLYDEAFEGDTIAAGLIYILNRYQYYLSKYENNPNNKCVIQNNTIELINYVYSTELSQKNHSIHNNWTEFANLVEFYDNNITHGIIAQHDPELYRGIIE